MFSPVFSQRRGDKVSLYIDEHDHESYPNRGNTLICSNVTLKDVRDGSMNVGLAGTLNYKIAVFEKSPDVTIEFIQFEDGVGSMVEVYKNSYVCADIIYNAMPLNYKIFEKSDNDNYYYERVIHSAIIRSRELDCFVTLYSDLYNIKCALSDNKNIKFTVQNGDQWTSIAIRQ